MKIDSEYLFRFVVILTVVWLAGFALYINLDSNCKDAARLSNAYDSLYSFKTGCMIQDKKDGEWRKQK